MPKKILKHIETICKKFLCTGEVGISRKALLAWDTLCKTKATGGMNITDITLWNKTAICKSLWNHCKKKDILWVTWVHMYYIKEKPSEEVQAKQASWVIQKIMKAKTNVEAAGYTLPYLQQIEDFSTSKIYNFMRGFFQKVDWRRLVCNNQGIQNRPLFSL